MDDIDDFMGELLGGATIGCLGAIVTVLVLVVLVTIIKVVL